MRFTRFVAFAASLTVGACAVEEQGTTTYSTRGTLEDFSTYVQPVLQVGCASLDCHGNDGRPLRLYALNGLRTSVSLRGLDASNAEMMENMTAIDGLDPGAEKIEDNLLLLKPLSVAAGGIHHIGGDLWLDQRDGVYRCLHAWLRAGVSDDAGRELCMQVLP